jgi:predicted PurR-regulated permease PerM
MSFFDSRHQRAAIILSLLAIGLAIALAPYATGLIAVPVLYVVLAPLHRWLTRWMPARPAGLLVVLVTVLGVVVPGIAILNLIVGQAQDIAGTVMTGPLLDRLRQLQIGPFDVGAEIVRLGQTVVAWLGGNALSLLGTVTRLSINIVLALFGLYYLLLNPDGVWSAVRPYIPFSPGNTEVLRDRFVAIAISTVIGTGLTATAQGLATTLGFTFTGLTNPLFWGVVTIVFAVLPVVGSGMIWAPGVLVLLFDGRPGAAAFLVGWSLATTGLIDYVFRPLVFNRFAQVHPLLTLVGAIGGVSYFGLLGLLVGPLALSYFFEILRMYRQEFVPAGTKSGFTEEHPIVLDSEGAPAPKTS